MAKITLADMAEMAGTTKQSAWNWQRRHNDFPPVCGLAKAVNGKTVELFDRAAAVTWMQRHGKIPLQDGSFAEKHNGRPALNRPDEPVMMASYPAIDNTLAAQFISGKNAPCRHRTAKTTRPAVTTTVRTKGIWPCPAM